MGELAEIRYDTARPTVAYTPFKETDKINCDPRYLKTTVTWEQVLTSALTEMYGDDFTYLPKPLKDQLVKDLAAAATQRAAKPFDNNFDAWHNSSYQRFYGTHCGGFLWYPIKLGAPPKVELDTGKLAAAADKALEAAKPKIVALSRSSAHPGELVTVVITGENFLPNSPFPADGKATTVTLGTGTSAIKFTPVVADDCQSITVTFRLADNAALGKQKLVVETRYGKAEVDFEVVAAQAAAEPTVVVPTPAVTRPRKVTPPRTTDRTPPPGPTAPADPCAGIVDDDMRAALGCP